MTTAHEAPRAAFRNKHTLTDDCGCYQCLKTFKVTDVEKWTDQKETALCPLCGVDTVLPMDPQNPQLLEQAHRLWFVNDGK